MKSIGLILSYLSQPSRVRNTRVVLWLVALLVVFVVVFSTIFHVLMAREDREFSWITSVYWTMTVMSTLGFGDITFRSGAGQAFTLVVLVTGALFILVLLPFTFIQFVFVPWVQHRDEARAPRKLPGSTSGHILLTDTGPIEDALIRRADNARVPYVVIVPDPSEALRLFDAGYKVMIGDLDDPDTYRAAQVENAALIAVTNSDTTNANTAFTIREIDPEVPIVATADAEQSVDVLELAGCNQVLRLGDMLGRAIAQRVLGTDGRTHVVGQLDRLQIAEASPANTSLVGSDLRTADLRGRCNLSVVGVRTHGVFAMATPTTMITPSTVLLLAGSAEELRTYDDTFGIERPVDDAVIIIGGGRVGRAAGRTLAMASIDYRIVERQPDRIRDVDHYVLGNASDLAVLKEAGIDRAPAVLVTTHDDDINVYLTIYVRKLRPDVQIISRSNLDRNVSTLHRAGADSVLSYASTGSVAIWNTLEFNNSLVIGEDLDVFRVTMPEALAGRSLETAKIRETTGCNVVAVAQGDDTETNPDPTEPLPSTGDLIVIGTSEAAKKFHDHYPTPVPGPG